MSEHNGVKTRVHMTASSNNNGDIEPMDADDANNDDGSVDTVWSRLIPVLPMMIRWLSTANRVAGMLATIAMTMNRTNPSHMAVMRSCRACDAAVLSAGVGVATRCPLMSSLLPLMVSV